MDGDFHTAVFPLEHMDRHIVRDDLRAFKNIGLDRINGGSHLAQLKRSSRTIGLSSLQVFPQYEEVHITYIEICSDVRGGELGRRLLVPVFDYAVEMSEELGKQVFVTVGGFTPKGKRSILPKMRELSIDYSVKGVTFDPPEIYR